MMYRLSWVRPRVRSLLIRDWKQLATAKKAKTQTQKSRKKQSVFNKKAHTLAYSIIGLQEANLAYHYPIIYWNTANLISDSGGEDGNVNYGKVATAVNNFQKQGIHISLPNINKSMFGFYPDEKNNQIIYGLKPILGIGTKVVKMIVENRPYASMKDFYEKMQVIKGESPDNKFGDVAMLTLIKAGAFDELEKKNRIEIMKDFIKMIAKPLSSLKISNIEDLASNDLLTEEQRKYELRLYRFRNYIFNKKFLAKQTGKSITTAYYKLDRKYAEPYFYENFETYMNEGKDYEYSEDGFIIVKRGSFERVFNKLMEDFKDNVLSNPELLNKINELKFNNIWNEKAYGTIAKWEMDSLCFYYSGHELSEIEESKYNIVDFNSLNEEPEISDYYFYRGQQKPRFKLVRIAGTVIDKNKDHHVVTLLTTHGIVNVKFYKGQFSFYDKQISEKVEGEESTKVIEKSWFARGEKLLITGFRRGEQFIPKKYGDSIYTHSVQLITTITSEGNLILKSERANQNE